MVKSLLSRPIGTVVVVIALAILGIITGKKLPISLLPEIPVPEITVLATCTGLDSRQIQQTLTIPIRNQLLQLSHLEDLEATTVDGETSLKLRFEYGTNVDLAHIEANEKIDAIMSQLPRQYDRPRVIKASAGDIPVFQLNVFPESADSSGFLQVSEFCESTLKRRLEQLSDVAFVDVTGQAKSEMVVRLDHEKLAGSQLLPDDIATALERWNVAPESIVVREGPYEYSIRLGATISNKEELLNIYLTIGESLSSKRIIQLRDVASIDIEEKPESGLHIYNGRRSVGLAIVKRSDAQLFGLRDQLNNLVETFRRDYPTLRFEVSQDQTEILEVSISNLINSLVAGAILTFVMILFFMRDKKVLLIIALVIPISFSITMLGFFLLGISINIVSLAGLILGVGEIVDSAIIIVENIEEHRNNSEVDNTSIEEACTSGTEEVIRPLFTSVLTNSAVFFPLLFLSGIAGALFYEQAIAVSLSLGISLLVSYTLVPVLYYAVSRNSKAHMKGHTRAMKIASKLYSAVFTWAFRYPFFILTALVLLFGMGIWIFNVIEKEGMPSLNRVDLDYFIEWNEPLSVSENRTRIDKLISRLSVAPKTSNIYVGTQQFLLSTRPAQVPSEALLVIKAKTPEEYVSIGNELSTLLKEIYPAANGVMHPAENVFEQLFQTSQPELVLKIFSQQSDLIPSLDKAEQISNALRQGGVNVASPPKRYEIAISIDREKLSLYQVDYENIISTLKTILGKHQVGTLPYNQKDIPIVFGGANSSNIDSTLQFTSVVSESGNVIPIRELIHYKKSRDYATLYMDHNGAYLRIIPKIPIEISVKSMESRIEDLISFIPGVIAKFDGTYIKSELYLAELMQAILIAVLMLFVILTAQFESMLQPLIVLSTVVLGILGALLGLYYMGESLNIMSAVGLVVLIGLLDNDSILKIDTMNRERGHLVLMQAIKKGGQKRLQSQLMTFLTTVLGLVPVLWTSGLGAELQRPLTIAILFGMSLGVFVSWTFIPLLYWFITSRWGGAR